MSRAFVYQAALLCETCGNLQRHNCVESEDSDRFPQGPFPDGGGEADTPQHCDYCGVFLENPLTADGDTYVRDKAAPYDAPDSSWEEIAARAEADGQAILAEWIRYYLAPGQ